MGINSFGRHFAFTTYGESHGPGIGVIVDGVPAGYDIDPELIQQDLDRRRPGQSDVTTPRRESDKVHILSGIFKGKTTGQPIGMSISNDDAVSTQYANIKDLFRPGHADYTYHAKYSIRDYRGSGRASAGMRGSEHNDPIGPEGFITNHAGGVLGGISTGQPLVFRIAVKPTSSIARKQQTIDTGGKPVNFAIDGRNDPCLIPRMVPVIEAMTACVIADMVLLNRLSRRDY